MSKDGTPMGGADRVLAILKAVAVHPKGARLEELATEVTSPKSSVHRALATLRRSGLVDQDERGHYRLGYEFLRIAFTYYDSLDLRNLIEPVLERISGRIRETAHYAELDGDEVVYIAKMDPPGTHFQMTSRVGGRNPAHCTGIGKAVLAYRLPNRDAVGEYVATYGPLLKRTDRTLTSVDALNEDLEATRRRGYALDREESERGLVCLAFPVFLASRTRPSGAISITALKHRTPLEALTASANDIRSLIEQHLGPTRPAVREPAGDSSSVLGSNPE